MPIGINAQEQQALTRQIADWKKELEQMQTEAAAAEARSERAQHEAGQLDQVQQRMDELSDRIRKAEARAAEQQQSDD